MRPTSIRVASSGYIRRHSQWGSYEAERNGASAPVARSIYTSLRWDVRLMNTTDRLT